MLRVMWLLLFCVALSSADCLGEYQQCSGGDCVLYAPDCGTCKSGQFLCPDRKTCVKDANSYVTCPGLRNTHLDWTLSHDQRVAYLVNVTTLAEQIAQLTNNAPAIPRLGIPAYNWLNDDEHGIRLPQGTSFPNGCGLGAMWDKDTMRAVGTAIGVEARGLHNMFVHQGNRGQDGENGVGITMYAPNMNLVRDPRWGRAQEVYGEDPYLSSRLTYEFVTGGQGNDKYMRAGACCKHYAAYDIESIPKERYYFDAQIDSVNMWETYMPVFEACVNDAQAMHVMSSYNAINGIPTSADPNLLNGILRDQWGWDGFVVSDYDAWAQVMETHKYCLTYECAAAAGINAGMDQEGGGTVVIKQLATAIAANRTTAKNVAVAFGRLFRARIKLGMLDPPTMNPHNYVLVSDIIRAEHEQIARTAGAKAMSLYQNRGGVLPLPLSIPSVAVIGPQGPDGVLLLGNYAVPPTRGCVSILQGIQGALGDTSSFECEFEQDVDYYVPNLEGIPAATAGDCCYLCSYDSECKFYTWYEGLCYKKSDASGRVSSPGRVSGRSLSLDRVLYAPGCKTVPCTDTSGFATAVTAAKTASAVIVLLGLNQDLEAEGHDRTTIALPPNQDELIKTIRAAVPGKPVVAVLVHGGTLALRNVLNNADAVVDAWYPGMEGGNSLADVLFGLVNPAGRAAVTSYESDAQLQPMGQMNLYAGNGTTYRYFSGTPTIPFGFGLSYTTFQYSNLRFKNSSVDACDRIHATVTVTNTGSRDGEEVVQLYTEQKNRPFVRLGAFERVMIHAGDSVDVPLTLEPRYHSRVVNRTDIFHPMIFVDAGPVQIAVGGGQPRYYAGALRGQVTVVNTRNMDSC